MRSRNNSRIFVTLLSLIFALILAFAVGCKNSEEPAPEVSITLDQSEVVLQIGALDSTWAQTLVIATVKGSEADVVWTSSNEEIAIVSGGRVLGKSKGTTTVTAKVGNASATCEVEIKEFLPELTLNIESVTLLETEKETVTAQLTSHGKQIKNVLFKYESNNNNVATVENGEIYGVAKGEATITVTTDGLGKGKEISDTVAVNVNEKIVSYKVQRWIPDTSSEDGVLAFVKDGEAVSTSSKPDNDVIMESLWTYKGMVLYTQQNMIDAGSDSGTFSGWEINDDGSSIIDAYYVDALSVSGSDGKMYLIYQSTDYNVGYSANAYKNIGMVEGKENVYEVSDVESKTGTAIDYFMGMSKDDLTDKGFDRLSFYIRNTSSSNIVMYVNGTAASLHLSDNMSKLTAVKVYDASGNKVSNISLDDTSWYKVVIDLTEVNDRTVGTGLDIGFRLRANASFQIADAQVYEAPAAAAYTVEYYFNDGMGNYVKDDNETVVSSASIGETVSAETKVYMGYIYDSTVNGTLTSGKVLEDGSLTLKLYYDNAIAVKNGEGYAYINAMSTAAAYQSAGAIDAVGEFEGVADAYKITQSSSMKTMLLLLGISPAELSASGYTHLSFKLYFDVEDDAKYNFAVTLTNVSGNSENALRPSDYNSGNSLTSYVTVTKEGEVVTEVARKTWVTVTIDLSDIDGKSNSAISCLYLQMGDKSYASTYYIADAELFKVSTAAYAVEYYFNDGTGTYVLNSDLTETKTGDIGNEVSADYKVFTAYNPNKTHTDTVMSGEVVEDGSLVLKLYYDNAIAVKNGDGYAYINAISTAAAYQGAGSICAVGEFEGVADAYKITQSSSMKTMLLLSGISPAELLASGYTHLSFKLYFDVEDDAKYNFAVTLTNVSGNSENALRPSDYNGGNSLTSYVTVTKEGEVVTEVARKTWVTVTIDLSDIDGKSNSAISCLYLQMGDKSYASTYYIADAELFTPTTAEV